uniref:Uncharacterized protein n=1 Tax=Setaria viridis TaxID=4556 RepID=A0A4U6VV11_SETVI|nr:hypothetical protein SEVIR_2G178900v2 [Setaria viridis]
MGTTSARSVRVLTADWAGNEALTATWAGRGSPIKPPRSQASSLPTLEPDLLFLRGEPERERRKGRKEEREERRGRSLVVISGVLVPMCFCGDPCKVAKSDEEDTSRQRYSMCSNFQFESTPAPDQQDENKERMDKRLREEAAEKEHKEEEERRRLAAERERKLERARRAKAAIEENPDALRKEKWPRCTQ